MYWQEGKGSVCKGQIFQTRLFRAIYVDLYSMSSSCFMCGETIVEKVDIRVKRRAAIHFCNHLGKNQQEMYMSMREAYKEKCFAIRTVQYWHKSFSDG